jgi:enamine deaminase RidA (YjgF/YER057c/UK114 family)
LENDPSFNQAVDELKREGPAGVQALAALIDELLAARCAEIQDVLSVASRLSSQPDLVNAVQRVISASPVIAEQPGRFPPVIVGGGRIGWDDAVARRIKEQASEVLTSLRAACEATASKSPTQPPADVPAKQSAPDPQAIIVVCTKCNRQYHLGVDAAVVSDEGVGEDFAVVVGSNKGGGPDSPDLVAPLAEGRTPSQDTLKEVERLQRFRAAATARYWQCNLCKTVLPYPWVSVGAKGSTAFYDQLIHVAVLDGDLTRIRSLLKDNPDRVFSQNSSGETPLHMAALLGREDAVLLFLNCKADVNAKNKAGYTPLHNAMMMGKGVGAARILLGSGAEVNAKNTAGQTPLQVALIMNHQGPARDVLELLRMNGGHE